MDEARCEVLVELMPRGYTDRLMLSTKNSLPGGWSAFQDGGLTA